MALREALSAEQDECIVIGFGLVPPNLLVTIHLRTEPRCQETNCQEGGLLES